MIAKLMPFCVFYLLFVCISCKQEKSSIPAINLIDVSNVEVLHAQQDSIFIKIGFEDGDGDLGNDSKNSIFVYDSRNDSLYASFPLPQYMQTASGLIKKGEYRFKIHSPCCFIPLSYSCDTISRNKTQTMTFLIQMQDAAGNKSNKISTDSIMLICKH